MESIRPRDFAGAWRKMNRIREYDFNNDVLPVVNNVLLNRDAAITANDSFVAVTDKLASNIERLLKTASRRILFSIWGCATARAGRHRLTAERGLLGIEKNYRVELAG